VQPNQLHHEARFEALDLCLGVDTGDIEAHLSIVSSPSPCHWIEFQSSWSIMKFVNALCHYRTVNIYPGNHTLTAANPRLSDPQKTLAVITHPATQ
jgi:hypothetical protein